MRCSAPRVRRERGGGSLAAAARAAARARGARASSRPRRASRGRDRRTSGRSRIEDARGPRAAVPAHESFGAGELEHRRDHVARVGLVVDDEHPEPVERRRRLRPHGPVGRGLARLGRRQRDGGTTVARGSRTVKTAPVRPSGRLAASTVPPCSSTRCRTMARPSPRPPCGRVRGGVRLPEPLEDVRQELRPDAGPVVRDGDLRLRRRRGAAGRVTRPPRGANLIAFESRFQTTCWRRSASPDERRPPDRGPARASRSRAWRRGPDRVERGADDVDEADRLHGRGAACRP